jgi:hypothetical protein
MSRKWIFEIALFLGVCLVMVGASHLLRGVRGLPVLPLNEKLSGENADGSWDEHFGDLVYGAGAPLAAEGGAIIDKEGGVEVTSPFQIRRGEAELVVADKEGRFEGSWCRGRLGFASLVLPQENSKGRISMKWTIPFYDIHGETIPEDKRGPLKANLAPYLSGRSSEPYLDYDGEHYASPVAFGLLLVEEASLEWGAESFSSFDAGNHFGAHSSRVEKTEAGVTGEAGMFTWHRAPIRMSWDLVGKGEIGPVEMELKDGAGFQKGGFHLRVIGGRPGRYALKTGEGKLRPGDAVVFKKEDEAATIRTLFLGGTIPGRSYSRIEWRGADATWQPSTFTAADTGIVAVAVGADAMALRISWKPRQMRVVVDIPGIGGSLPENEGVTTYNEIRFPLHGAPVENQGMSWRLWQLLGSYPRIHADHFDSARAPGTRAEPGQLYRADDLYRTWQRMNPDLRFEYDEKLDAIVIEDR